VRLAEQSRRANGTSSKTSPVVRTPSRLLSFHWSYTPFFPFAHLLLALSQARSLMHMQQKTRDGTLPQVNIALLGARGVGKSTFIQNSFDLRQLPSEVITSKKMSLDGVVYLVRLVEMRFHEVVLDEAKIKWPKYLQDLEVPSIDGVLALCDVTDLESLTDTKELLRTCLLVISASVVRNAAAPCKEPSGEAERSCPFHRPLMCGISH